MKVIRMKEFAIIFGVLSVIMAIWGIKQTTYFLREWDKDPLCHKAPWFLGVIYVGGGSIVTIGAIVLILVMYVLGKTAI